MAVRRWPDSCGALDHDMAAAASSWPNKRKAAAVYGSDVPRLFRNAEYRDPDAAPIRVLVRSLRCPISIVGANDFNALLRRSRPRINIDGQ